jgi:hypothetical protein
LVEQLHQQQVVDLAYLPYHPSFLPYLLLLASFAWLIAF